MIFRVNEGKKTKYYSCMCVSNNITSLFCVNIYFYLIAIMVVANDGQFIVLDRHLCLNRDLYNDFKKDIIFRL